MALNKILLCLMALFLNMPFHSSSQTIKGDVASAKDGKPLNNVKVRLQNYHCMPSYIFSTVTDSLGKFNLDIKRLLPQCTKDKIEIYLYLEGYKPHTLTIYRKDFKKKAEVKLHLE